MNAVLGVRVPRGEHGEPLTGLSEEIVVEISPQEYALHQERERKILDDIAKALLPAFSRYVEEYRNEEVAD